MKPLILLIVGLGLAGLAVYLAGVRWSLRVLGNSDEPYMDGMPLAC